MGIDQFKFRTNSFFNPSMEIFQAIIITHLVVIAIYMPNKIDTEEMFDKVISYLVL